METPLQELETLSRCFETPLTEKYRSGIEGYNTNESTTRYGALRKAEAKP